jgi:hypothetical protein
VTRKPSSIESARLWCCCVAMEAGKAASSPRSSRRRLPPVAFNAGETPQNYQHPRGIGDRSGLLIVLVRTRPFVLGSVTGVLAPMTAKQPKTTADAQ